MRPPSYFCSFVLLFEWRAVQHNVLNTSLATNERTNKQTNKAKQTSKYKQRRCNFLFFIVASAPVQVGSNSLASSITNGTLASFATDDNYLTCLSTFIVRILSLYNIAMKASTTSTNIQV